MGKTLEILKIGDAARTERPEPAAEPAPRADQVHVTEWTLQEEGVPFVEVGPNKLFEASPTVMAAKHPAHAFQPPHGKTQQALFRQAPKLVEAAPMKVGYQTAEPALPVGEVAPEIVAFRHPEHAVAKQYADLLERMLGETRGQGGRVVLLAGIRSNVGASTCLLNLAVVAARRPNARVAVVDANVRRPDLAGKLGLGPACGLEDAIAGTAALERIAIPTPIAALHALPSLGRSIDPALRGEALGWIVGWLRERYELVLIDGPSLEDRDDFALLAPCADATFLVVPEAETAGARTGAAARLARLGGKLRGILHTSFEA